MPRFASRLHRRPRHRERKGEPGLRSPEATEESPRGGDKQTEPADVERKMNGREMSRHFTERAGLEVAMEDSVPEGVKGQADEFHHHEDPDPCPGVVSSHCSSLPVRFVSQVWIASTAILGQEVCLLCSPRPRPVGSFPQPESGRRKSAPAIEEMLTRSSRSGKPRPRLLIRRGLTIPRVRAQNPG